MGCPSHSFQIAWRALTAAVALALVGFIGYTLATCKGKASPVPTIQNKEETVTNR